MNFRKVNNITGWAVFLIAMATYMLTREARGSLWDCGEFVSSAYKMELPHPPGAPMFTLLGRFFIILFGDNGQTAANAVNFMSAMASAATILFLFWSITHFARKMFVNAGEELTSQQIFTVMGAGIIGGLAYTFCDSFWYSAVEGEVYALSSFFTALVFWAMLKWEHADEHAGNDATGRARADRWIVFLFFMMGLSIGVHILNLLTIPAIVMIYYFRRYYKAEPLKAEFALLKKDQLIVWDAVITIGLVLLLIIANVMNQDSDLMGIALLLGFIGLFIALIAIYAKYRAIRNMISAFIIGCLITGIVQVGIIQYSMKSAGIFDVFFVNSLKFPFFTGFTIYFIVLAAVIVWAFRFNDKNISRVKTIIWFILFLGLSALPFFVSTGNDGEKVLKFLLTAGVAVLIGYFFKASGLRVLRLALWCYAFIMLGYFMYFTALIRSNANPAIDMNNVDNPISLVYYLSREQYGSAPLVYGPHFEADYALDDASSNGIAMKKGEMKFVKSKDIKGKDKYVETGTEDEPTFNSADMQFFPRVWDKSNDQGHFNFYITWLDLKQNDEQNQQKGRGRYIPTYANNAEWFMTYQMDLMYWRYFMWNFAGKQNDVQGLGSVRDGNWISGIGPLDDMRLGDQSKLPDSLKTNKAHNKLYMLPFILGILGCVYQFIRNKRDWIVNFLLFFLTGIAVVLYLNQPGNQPRERDYAYVGSFYAFAIWIGLAVVGFVRMASEKEDRKTFINTIVYGSVLTLVIVLMSSLRIKFSGILAATVGVTILFALVTGGFTYLLRAISSGGQNKRILNIATTAVCLIVPLIMAQQEWDDHDRSKKTTAPDLAKDYLESCEKNAILFTFGDNDTYPLWYAQEVEGVRPDIRIINNSLLGIDWYINQLRYKINDADSVDVLWTPEQIEGHKREYLRYKLDPKADPNYYYPLLDIMKNVLGKSDIDPETGRDRSDPESFPVTKLRIPVDLAMVKANGTVNPNDSVMSPMLFEIPENRARGLQRNDLVILSVIAANNWKRPIYFSSPPGLGFDQYLRKDGMSYRLVPVITKSPEQNWVFESAIGAQERLYQRGLTARQIFDNNDSLMYRNLMEKFEFGGANKKGVYFDEENRRHILNIRSTYAEAAGSLADEGKKDEAVKLLTKADAGILAENMDYAMTSRFNSHNQTGLIFLEACYKAGKSDLAEKVSKSLKKDFEQQVNYYADEGGMSRTEMDNIMNTYEKSLSEAAMKMMIAKTREEQNSARAEMNMADSYFLSSLRGSQKGLMNEIIINRALMKTMDAIEQKYVPGKQPAVTPPRENPQSILNTPGANDTTPKTDTSKK